VITLNFSNSGALQQSVNTESSHAAKFRMPSNRVFLHYTTMPVLQSAASHLMSTEQAAAQSGFVVISYDALFEDQTGQEVALAFAEVERLVRKAVQEWAGESGLPHLNQEEISVQVCGCSCCGAVSHCGCLEMVRV